MRGQIVKVPKNMPKGIEIEFYDYSILRITSGSQLKIGDRSTVLDPQDELPMRIKISFLLGKIWAKISTDPPPNYNIQTVCAVIGNRGTTFSVEYEPTTERTTVIVEEGTVWLENLRGQPKTIEINKGETEIQVLNGAAVLKPN